MPPRLKILSAKEVVSIFEEFGFKTLSQRGSHIKLRRATMEGLRETLIIPDHKELDKGTLKAIIRQASKYIPVDSLYPHFYSK